MPMRDTQDTRSIRFSLCGCSGQDSLAAQIQQPQFGQLFPFHRRGRASQRTGGAAVLGERDYLADGRSLQDHRHGAVHAQRQPAMRRRAEIEGPQEEAELLLRFFFGESERGEYLPLDVAVVDADAAAAQLLAVHDQVIGPRAQRQQFLDVLGVEVGAVRRGERMVAGGDASLLGGLEQRELRDPDRIEGVGGNQAEAVRQMQAQLPERRGDDGIRGIGDHDEDVAVGDDRIC